MHAAEIASVPEVVDEASLEEIPPAGADDEAPWQDLMVDPIAPEAIVEEPTPAEADLTDLVTSIQEPIDQAAEIPLGVPEGAPAYSPAPDLGSTTDALTASADELAQFARAVELPTFDEGIDSVSATADLVEEAVASYEEQHADFDAESGRASTMPPLAKALVEGERVSLGDMESVVEEHDQTGQSIARILTTRSW